MRTIAAALIILFSASVASAACGNFRFCSKTFYAIGECTGLESTPIFERPWEASDIAIVGVTVGLQVPGPFIHGYAIAGNSGNPDVMSMQVGSGSNTVMFPDGYSFSFAAKSGTHLDLHVACSGADKFQAWLVIFYTQDVKTAH